MSIADYGFAIWETFYVTVLSTAFSLVIGHMKPTVIVVLVFLFTISSTLTVKRSTHRILRMILR